MTIAHTAHTTLVRYGAQIVAKLRNFSSYASNRCVRDTLKKIMLDMGNPANARDPHTSLYAPIDFDIALFRDLGAAPEMEQDAIMDECLLAAGLTPPDGVDWTPRLQFNELGVLRLVDAIFDNVREECQTAGWSDRETAEQWARMNSPEYDEKGKAIYTLSACKVRGGKPVTVRFEASELFEAA